MDNKDYTELFLMLKNITGHDYNTYKRKGSLKKLRNDVHTYESMQNLKYSDGRDLFPMVSKGFLYILNHP